MEKPRNHRGRGRGKPRYHNANQKQAGFTGRKIEPSRNLRKNELPIYQNKESILNHIAKYSISIFQSPTGSGKSTQIPQYIYEVYPQCITVIAQPLKLGASELASRVAEEMDTHIGGLVGTLFKGETKSSSDTRIFFTTTDCLLETILNEGFNWDFIIVDEVHERSLETDILLAVIKLRMKEAKQFKLIILSATIQKIVVSYFSAYDLSSGLDRLNKKSKEKEINWDGSDDDNVEDPEDIESILSSSQLFDTEEIYLEKILDIIEPLKDTVFRELRPITMDNLISIFSKDADTHPLEINSLLYEVAVRIICVQHLQLFREEDRPYTFLVFLPGEYEINLINEVFYRILGEKTSEFEVIHLHANIQEEDYHRIFDEPEPGKRRVIFSSNIAESSITLTDVRFIIDFGLNRENAFNNQKNYEAFELVWAPKAIMKQRAGRVGRVANGIVFRLMPIQFFNTMLYAFAKPEIQRSSLDKIILKLKIKNIENVRDLLTTILEAPDDIEIVKTEKYLIETGALAPNKKITPLGEIYSEFPFEIKVTRICMMGILMGCFKESMILGALIASDRSPFKRYSDFPGNKCREHPKTYMNKLVFERKSCSDLLTMFNVYNQWYHEIGKNIKDYIYKNNKKCLGRTRIHDTERIFCEEFTLDPNILREIRSVYCEIKEKFKSLGVDERHYKEINQPSVTEFTLKLCIAAAFPGKYLISRYEIPDKVTRDRLIGKIGENYKTSLLIPDIPDSVSASDIHSLLHLNRNQPTNINIVYSNCIIEYHPSVNPNALKFVMWLGSYFKRYQNLAWVLMKRVTRNQYNKIIKKELQNLNINDLNKVFIGQRKPGSRVDINRDKDGRNEIVDEVVFLAKPEYPFKLNFQDICSTSEVIIEDESVNCNLFAPDPEQSQKFMLVCSEYIMRRNIIIGKNSTLMPFKPLLPHLLSLVFCSRIEYYTNSSGNRYKGIRFINSGNTLNFDYSFTVEDARLINKIRKELGTVLGNQEYLKDFSKLSSISSDIQELINRPRMVVNLNLPDWKTIIGWESEIITFVPEPEDIYNIPLIPINEDLSLYYSFDVQCEIKQKKLDYVKSLQNLCTKALSCKTELVCIECGESFCGLDGISMVEHGLFEIVTEYGKVETVERIDKFNEFTEFVQDYFFPDAWEVCRNGHVIGWNANGSTFVSDKSPVAFRLPGNIIKRLTEEIWTNNFYELNIQSELAKKEYDSFKFNFECKLCEEVFKKSQEFYSHIISEDHKNNVALFLEPYVVS